MKKTRNVKIKAHLSRQTVFSEKSKETNKLYDQSRFGEPIKDRYQYSLVESAYLLEKAKMIVYDSKNKKLTFKQIVNRAKKIQPNFLVRYTVYKDIRDRGYIIKTALKFGADFRIYDRGIKPGQDHAKWILFPVHESEAYSWHEFASKNRVAHSTRKNLLIGIVDDEGDVTFYEIKWTRP